MRFSYRLIHNTPAFCRVTLKIMTKDFNWRNYFLYRNEVIYPEIRFSLRLQWFLADQNSKIMDWWIAMYNIKREWPSLKSSFEFGLRQHDGFHEYVLLLFRMPACCTSYGRNCQLIFIGCRHSSLFVLHFMIPDLNLKFAVRVWWAKRQSDEPSNTERQLLLLRNI